MREPLCRPCRAAGRVTVATAVDHIVPIAVRPDLALDINNLQAICHRCNALKALSDQQRA